MHRIWLPVALAASGCLTTVNLRGGRDGLEGAGMGIEGPVSKYRFGIEANWETVPNEAEEATEGERIGVLAYDVTFRLGLVSAVLEERCKDTCTSDPWFDIGPGGGLGLAITGEFDPVGHAWVGAWADVRLSPTESYPILRVELQQDAYSHEPVGGTQLVFAVGWVNWDVSLKH